MPAPAAALAAVAERLDGMDAYDLATLRSDAGLEVEGCVVWLREDGRLVAWAGNEEDPGMDRPVECVPALAPLLVAATERTEAQRRWEHSILAAVEAGQSVTEVAMAAGVSRQAVYDVLRRHRASSAP